MSPETDGSRNRLGKRWTDEEEIILEAGLGRLSTDQLAKRLGRNRRSIQNRCQKLGISPYDNDGYYTPAELSRLTGIPASTLHEQIEKGKIKGVKVGSFWRVEWDGSSDIRPSWDGRTLHKEVVQELGKVDRCINCGGEFKKNARLWCSKKCRGEYIRKIVDERLSQI